MYSCFPYYRRFCPNVKRETGLGGRKKRDSPRTAGKREGDFRKRPRAGKAPPFVGNHRQIRLFEKFSRKFLP